MRISANLLILVVLLLAAGCPKGEQAGAASPRVKARSAEAGATAPGTAPGSQSGQLKAMEQNKVLTPEASQGAQTDPASPEQRELVKTTLISVLPARQLKFDDASGRILGAGAWSKGVAIDQAVNIIAAKLKTGPGFAPDTVKSYSEGFLDDVQKMFDRTHAGHEGPVARDPSHGTEGQSSQVLSDQKPPKFTPARSVAGEWRSLREVNEAYTYQVNHNDLYYETMSLRPDGTMTWVVYRGGTPLSTDEYNWKYNAGKGELTVSFPQGTVYQTLKVFTADNDPGNLYFRTPNIDRIKVFGKWQPPAQ
jgi:hypothetical protein